MLQKAERYTVIQQSNILLNFSNRANKGSANLKPWALCSILAELSLRPLGY